MKGLFLNPDTRLILKSYGKRGKGYQSRDNAAVKTLKAFHMLAATAWAGGALSMQALSYLKLSTHDPAMRDMAAYCLHFVDTAVVIPGLAGCLLTGLVYSTMTSIGFFKFFWIGVKWFISCAAGFWGGLFWGPWGDDLIAMAAVHGLDWPLRFIKACILPENMWQGFMQICIILFMCLISVMRPRTILPKRFRKKLSQRRHAAAVADVDDDEDDEAGAYTWRTAAPGARVDENEE